MDFEELLDKYRTDVERFVRFRLTSITEAEDVLQEVFFGEVYVHWYDCMTDLFVG